MNWKAVLWILATVICDICALYFGYATLWVLGFFLTLVLLFAFIMILFSFWHLSFRQVLSRSAVEKHEEAQLLVQCQNNGFLFYPTVWLHYISGERKQISAYPGEQEQKVGYIFPMKGIYPVGVKKIVVYEPFGIFCRRIRIKEPQKLFVLPRTIPLQETPMMDTGKSSEEGKRKNRAVDRSIVSGLREYEYGDTLNSINWKATAKRNEVIVNCYENEFCIKAFVYVERFQMPEQPAVAALLEDAACDHAITQIKMTMREEGFATLFFKGKETVLENSMVKSFEEYGVYLAEQGTLENENEEDLVLLEKTLFQKDVYNRAFFYLQKMTPQLQLLITQLQNHHVQVEVYLVSMGTQAGRSIPQVVLQTGQEGGTMHAGTT